MDDTEEDLDRLKEELQLRIEKVSLTTHFTRARKRLYTLLYENSSMKEVQWASTDIDVALDKIVDVIDKLAVKYFQDKQFEHIAKLILELEIVQKEYVRITEEFVDFQKAHLKIPCDSIGIKQEKEEFKEYSYQDSELLDKSVLKPREGETLRSHQRRDESLCLETDLWTQLKRVEIPVFSGDKRFYQSWKAAFEACIDKAPVTCEFKLLQLRQYLSGEALAAIENLGHSAAAYEAAKGRLERKYGGKRRQIALNLEELEQFGNLKNVTDFERFADILEVAVINLEEAGQNSELGNGTLLRILQRKLPEQLLAQYQRWLFEHGEHDSVLSLKNWVVQEAEFHIKASETVHGMRKPHPVTSEMSKINHQAFYSHAQNLHSQGQCEMCLGEHNIWKCSEFVSQNVSSRWNVARKLRLCFRCLQGGHKGKNCHNSKICGENACQGSHHSLLHKARKWSDISLQSVTNQALYDKSATTTNLSSLPSQRPKKENCSKEGNRSTEWNRSTEGNRPTEWNRSTEGNHFTEWNSTTEFNGSNDRNRIGEHLTEGNIILGQDHRAPHGWELSASHENKYRSYSGWTPSISHGGTSLVTTQDSRTPPKRQIDSGSQLFAS